MQVTTVSSEILVSSFGFSKILKPKFWFFYQNSKTKNTPNTTPQHHLNLTPFLNFTPGGTGQAFYITRGKKCRP